MKNNKDKDRAAESVADGADAEQKAGGGKIHFYVGAAACVAGAVAFGLAFTALGIYALISSVIIEIGALCFLRIQIKRNRFKAALIFYTAAYVLLGAFVLFFICGVIFSGI